MVPFLCSTDNKRSIGIATVLLKLPHQAEGIAEDFTNMLFLMGGTPRPVSCVVGTSLATSIVQGRGINGVSGPFGILLDAMKHLPGLTWPGTAKNGGKTRGQRGGRNSKAPTMFLELSVVDPETPEGVYVEKVREMLFKQQREWNEVR